MLLCMLRMNTLHRSVYCITTASHSYTSSAYNIVLGYTVEWGQQRCHWLIRVALRSHTAPTWLLPWDNATLPPTVQCDSFVPRLQRFSCFVFVYSAGEEKARVCVCALAEFVKVWCHRCKRLWFNTSSVERLRCFTRNAAIRCCRSLSIREILRVTPRTIAARICDCERSSLSFSALHWPFLLHGLRLQKFGVICSNKIARQ